jgi:alpha-mannosidase
VKLRISGHWSLPRACSADRASRNDEHILCPITSEITLTPGGRRVDVHTSIENMVKDHRIRATFPVLYTVEGVAAEGTFEVRTRPTVAPRPDDVSEWSEEPVNCFPQKRFVDISDGVTGLAILNRGLPEYEVVQNDAGQQAIAVTLLRCVDWLSRGDLATRRGHAGPMFYTPEGQCLGHHEFDYALVMHSGAWEAEEALVLREAQAFNTPIRAVATDQHAGNLPSTTAMIEVEPRSLVVSAIKRSGEDVIVRIYNPLPHAVEASLRPGFACEKAFAANLLEEPGQQVFWNGWEPLHVGLRSGEIATILFI